MCQDCLREQLPERGTTVLDAGHYLMNLKACAACSKRDIPVLRNRKKNGVKEGGRENGETMGNGVSGEDDEGDREYGEDEEEIVYERGFGVLGEQHVVRLVAEISLLHSTDACSSCGHLIATHTYNFNVIKPSGTSTDSSEWTQTYTMECDLCGTGERENSVGVSDPQRMREAGYAAVSDD